MNAKELKEQVLTELNTILEMSIEEIEKANEKTMAELLEIRWDYRSKKSDISQVFGYNSEHLPEDWEIKHEQLTFSFSGTMAPTIQKMVKSQFPDGKESKHKEPTKKQCDYNGKMLQGKIDVFRRAFKNGSTMLTYDEKMNDCSYQGNNELFKEHVIEIYKKSKPNDLIRLCWKFITDPKSLEGVHYAWENPVAKFEPYGSFKLPDYMETKTKVA